MNWVESSIVLENNNKDLNEQLGRMDGDRIEALTLLRHTHLEK